MLIQFATNDRQTALRHLNGFRSREVFDTPEDAAPVLDLVAEGLFRIPDPKMHPNGGIMPGEKWDESRRDEATKILSTWMST
jgi:hypothetical protein